MRQSIRCSLGPLLCALCLLLLPPSLRCRADDTLPPTELVSGQLKGTHAEQDTLDGAFPGLLLTVRDHDSLFDTRYHQPYRATCCAYIARKSTDSGGSTDYSRRFVVHVPDSEALPTAKRVARLLLLLQGEMQSHLRVDHPGRYQTVSVWLTRRVERGLSPDTAGEQFKDQIYIYDLFADRRAVEWSREVAHEYGHFALAPGAIGFTAPEDDSNGVLGERLFLKWLWTDVHSGRLHAEALPFLTPDMLDTYAALQVAPLVRRVARAGPDAHQLAKRDMEGMDYYIGFLLYLDTLYGSRQFQDIRACTRPGQSGDFLHAPDFLRGAALSLTETTDQTLHLVGLSADNRSAAIAVYLPRGEYHLRAEGSVASWQAEEPGLHAGSQTSLSVKQGGWHRLTVTFAAPPDAATLLHLRRTSK
jgi:hypothetical protein